MAAPTVTEIMLPVCQRKLYFTCLAKTLWLIITCKYRNYKHRWFVKGFSIKFPLYVYVHPITAVIACYIDLQVTFFLWVGEGVSYYVIWNPDHPEMGQCLERSG